MDRKYFKERIPPPLFEELESMASSVQKKSADYFVDHLTVPGAVGEPKKKLNVTYLHHLLSRWIKTEAQFKLENKNEADLASVPDCLGKIRKFKSVWFDDLKKGLEKEYWPNIDVVGPKFLRKSKDISERLRAKGNDYYKKKDLESALRCYNLALRYAPKDSKEEALAYSNKSACFAETGKWEEASREIERYETAFKSSSSEGEQVPRHIGARKLKCVQELTKLTKRHSHADWEREAAAEEEKQFGKEFFKLKNPGKAIPAGENFLGMRLDKKKGRGIYNVGDRPIEPGTLLILEDPYVHCPFTSFSFRVDQRCNACYGELKGGWIPCDGCVFNMYCSAQCFDSEHHKLHSLYECKMTPSLYEMNFSGKYTQHLALITLLKLGPSEFLSRWKDRPRPPLQTESATAPPQPQEVKCTIPGFSRDGVYSSSSYLPMYNLKRHDLAYYPERIQMELCMAAVFLTEVLNRETDYFQCMNLSPADTTAAMEEFASLLYLHQMSSHLNGLAIGYPNPLVENEAKGTEPVMPVTEENELGIAVYPLTSILNHSCDYNSLYVTLPGGTIAVIASQYIAPGQELTISYGVGFTTTGKDERRAQLESDFHFRCECDACFFDWSDPDERERKAKVDFGVAPICPKCRPGIARYQDFASIILPVADDKSGLMTCGSCKWSVTESDLFESLQQHIELAADGCKDVDEAGHWKG